jgi:subtilisin family serine protease
VTRRRPRATPDCRPPLATRTGLAALLALLLAVLLAGQPGAGAPSPAAAAGDAEVLVGWRAGTAPAPGDASALPAALRHVGRLDAIGVDRYRVDDGDVAAALAALRADPRVEFAEPNRHYRLLSTPNDPQFPGQWNMRQIHAPEAWDIGTGGADVVVAVLDSGIDLSHPDLQGRVVPGRNVRERNSNTQDEIGHGTHVAGLIGALGNNNVGVAGLSWAVRLMPIKITDRFGDASIVAAADGIRWATEYGAKIINLSLGGLDDSQTVRRAVADARARGVLLVAAAGNCGELASYRDEGCDTLNAPFFPAALPDVIAVGALGANDEVAPYSNTGDYVRLTAPGGVGGSGRGNPLDYILSTWPPGLDSAIGQPGYSYEVGTSMAAPHVSGTAALVWSTNPALTRDQVESTLFETADDLGPPGRDDRYGYGRVNAQRAIARAASLPGSRTANLQLTLETPGPDAVVQGALTVNGWAVDTQAETGNGVDQIEAYLDGPPGEGRALGPVRSGLARPDVARVLDRGGFANAGFSLTADVPSGVHTLYVRAHSALSGVWTVQQTRFIVGGSAPPAPMPGAGR